MKKILLLVLFFTTFCFGQKIGEYRSARSGNWDTLSSWEYYNGTLWIIPSAAKGYPGQFTDTNLVVIEQNHTITIGSTGIATEPFDQLTIKGSLLLIGSNKEVFFTIKTHAIIVTPNLNPIANIEFKNKGILQLPGDGSLQVTTGGLIGDCSNNQSIYVGDFEYSVCKGGNAGSTFDEVMEAGGTLNTVPSANSPVFVGETIFLTGDYIGPPGQNLSFEWLITDPLNNTTSTTDQNTSIPNAIEGVYTIKLTCYTTYSGIPYSNYETITVTVNIGQSISGPVALPGTGATCDEIIANWEGSIGANKYYLDVATDIDFYTLVAGYDNLDVGNTLTKKITGLTNATTYYYRVYASNTIITSPRSNTISYETLSIPSGLTATVTAQPTCTTSTGTVTLNFQYSDDDRYEYNVDGGPYQSKNRFTGLTSGHHNFTVRFLGENSCVSDPALAIINESPKTPIANAGSNFTKTCISNPSGLEIGSAPVDGVTYSWRPKLGLSDPTIANPIANPSITATYTLTATQTAGGCTDKDTVLVTVNLERPYADAGPDLLKACIQNPFGKIIGTPFVPGNTYSWNPPDFLSNPTFAQPLADPPTTTTYSVTVQDNTSGCIITDSMRFAVITIRPNADAGADFTKNCTNNPTGKQIGTTPFRNDTYSWSPTTGLSNAFISNPIANPTTTTTYTLTATNPISECTETDTVVVTVDVALPIANAGSDFTKTCSLNPNGAPIGSTTIAGVTYNWSPALGLSSATISNPTANPDTTTIYTLTTTNTSTGCTNTDPVLVTVNTTAPIADAGVDFTKTCSENSSGKKIGSDSVIGNTYNWTPSNGLSSTSLADPSANPTITTTYTLTVTNAASGCVATDSIIVTVDTNPPLANAGIAFNKTCALNPNGKTIGDTTIAGITYNWTPSIGLSNSTISNPIANPVETTTYTLTTKSTTNDCTNSDTVLVKVNTVTPIADAGTDFNKTCTENPSGKSIGSDPITGNIYNWSPTTGLSSTSIANPIANPTNTTTYTLTVTGENGCTAIDTIVATVNSTYPNTNAAGIDKTTNCSTPTVTIGNTAEPSTTYIWSPIEGLSSATVSNPTATPTLTTMYTLTATNTVSNCISTDSVTVNVDNAIPTSPLPNTPIQPNCETSTGSIVLNGLPLEDWTVAIYKDGTLNSSISGFGSTTTVNNLVAATYYFTVTITATGCTSPPSVNAVINSQPPTPSAPTIGTITDPTCASSGSVVLNNLPATGTWTLHQSGTSNAQISGSGIAITVSGLFPGTYQYLLVSDAGCVSNTSQDVIMINPSNGTEPKLGAIVHPDCETATGTINIINLPTTGPTITQTGPLPSNTTVNYNVPIGDSTFTTPDLSAGTYNFKISGADLCTTASGNITLNPQPPTPLAPSVNITNPSCGVSETTIILADLPSGNWTIRVLAGSTVIKTITGTGTSYNVTGVFTVGDYTATVTNEQGCVSPSSAVFTIIAQPLPLPPPTIGTITQPTCISSTGSVIINGLPATGTWILNQSGTSMTTYNGTGTSFTVTALTEGSYHFTVSGISGTCSSGISSSVIINKTKITPSAPIIENVTQPTCNSNIGSIQLSGLPVDSWTLYSSPQIGGGAGLIGSGTTAILTGAVTGTYTITVKNSDGCTSLSSSPITINEQPTTPEIPTLSIPIQPTCSIATGSFTIINYDSNNLYRVSPDTGVSVSGATISAPNGSYTVTATSGECVSTPSTIIEISKQPITPIAPIIVNVTQPTCKSSTGSIELSGLPADNWTLFATPSIGVGVGLSGSGTTAILTGAVVGNYTITVKNSDGCTSLPSSPFTLNEQPPTPPTPTISTAIQPSCTIATGNFTITNYNSSCIYIVTPSTGVSIFENTITAPTGNYTVTATLGNCTSETSSEIEIIEQPTTPTPPIIGNITQPNCDSNTGSVELSNLPSGDWVLFSLPQFGNGTGLSGTGTTAIFTGEITGTYTITVKNSDGCVSPPSSSFIINTQPTTPVIPILSIDTQPTCSNAYGSFIINNYDSNNTYSITPNVDTIISGNTITAPTGSYTVFAVFESCTSELSEIITIKSQPTTPTPPIIDFITQATCESITGSVGLSGLPQENWVLTSSGGITLAGQGTTAILNGNTVPGTYTVTVTNSDGCISTSSESISLYAQPTKPNAPTVGTIIQPNCTVATGTIIITDPAEGTGYKYNIDGGLYQTSAIFNNVNPGIHNLTCRAVTIDSCQSDATNVEVKAQLSANAPKIKSILQPSCTTKGNIILEELPTGNWILYQTGTTSQTITGSGTTTIISELEIGTYSYRVYDGICLSQKSQNALLKPLESTTWTGTEWTNGLPNIDKYIYTQGDYTFDKDIEMCSCQVITGLIRTKEGVTITIADQLETLENGNFSFDNTSSLIQKNEVINIGNIHYNRTSAPIFKSDYVHWSSPVALQQLGIASPNTPSNEFFSFDADTNNWEEEQPSHHMKISKGYSIGSPSGFYSRNIYSYSINFIGVPNNGTITTESIDGGKSYLIGNPYPSAVSADQFLTINKDVLNGTIYFWSHNPQINSLRDASNDYASYNASGGVGIAAKDPVTNSNNTIPTGTITAGQSFFIQGKNGVTSGIASFDNSMRIVGNNSQFFKFNTKTVTSGIASFDNSMRIVGNNSQFFKFNTKTKSPDGIEKNRIWLNVYNDQGAFKQTLVSYITDATNEFDTAFDGETFNGNKYIDFYSINQGKNLSIQGRALPFDENDMVPLGFSTTIDGVFSINIDQTDGLLTNHEVYLEDKEISVFYNLKNGPYRFNTSKGTFDNRFILHYKKEVPNPEKSDHPVIVSLKDGIIKVNSFFEVIDKLKIYDISGRLIYKKDNVNINEYYIQDFFSNDQVLIVKTILKNEDVVATKIVYIHYKT